MNRIIKNRVRLFVRFFLRFLMKLGLLKSKIIVRMDGGICSQMHFYIVGAYFKKKGYPVKYDLSWFNTCGKCCDGHRVRNFDLLKAFPKLDVPVSSVWENFYMKFFTYRNEYRDEAKKFNYLSLQAPVYLDSYYPFTREMIEKMMPSCFQFSDEILDSRSQEILHTIRSLEEPIAIHVRLGDLATFREGYGEPVPVKYFEKSIEYINAFCKEPVYFFFSDDIEYVNEKIIPKLNLNDNFYVVEGNGDDRGYMDLMLISECKHQISSKGAFGKYGGFISKNRDAKILVYDDESERRKWNDRSDKIIFIK